MDVSLAREDIGDIYRILDCKKSPKQVKWMTRKLFGKQWSFQSLIWQQTHEASPYLKALAAQRTNLKKPVENSFLSNIFRLSYFQICRQRLYINMATWPFISAENFVRP